MRIAVSYHDQITKLQEFASLARGPFDRAEWYTLLAQGGSEPLVAVASAGDRQVALALQRTGHALTSLTNWFSFTWRPLGNDELLLAALAKDLRSLSPYVLLEPVPDEDGSATRLQRAFRKGGWIVLREQSDENHVLPVRARSFADYWATRPGQMKTTLKRKSKKVEVEILKRFQQQEWDTYKEIYAQSWKPHEERADILEAFARAEGAAGRLRLGIARYGGDAVAAQFWTVEGGTAYIHKLAHTEAAKPLSAGTTLSAALFEHVIDTDKVALVDFGTGSDAYKRDWMEEIRPRYRLTCLDPRRLRSWPLLARHGLRRLASALGRG